MTGGSLIIESISSDFRRQIGKMLNAREPKIVNGPQILDKYVGESEANIRKLFAEADEEEKRVRPAGSTKDLHSSFRFSSWDPTVVYTSSSSMKSTPFAKHEAPWFVVEALFSNSNCAR